MHGFLDLFVEDIDLEATNGVQSMMNHHPSPKLNTNKKIKYNPKPTLLGLYVDLCEEKTQKKTLLSHIVFQILT